MDTRLPSDGGGHQSHLPEASRPWVVTRNILPPHLDTLNLLLLLSSGARTYRKTLMCHSCYTVSVSRKGDCLSAHEVSFAREGNLPPVSRSYCRKSWNSGHKEPRCLSSTFIEITVSTTMRLNYCPQTPTNFLADSLLLCADSKHAWSYLECTVSD